jgi:signal transduction histidine kinase
MVLRLDIGERIVVYGNQSLLSSIFRNLTENALAYSGGKNIYVTLVSHEKGLYHLRFEDDGCGVEEEKLSRLFERFYRVDTARSRASGGTGLGLALVRHAVERGGGTIELSSQVGVGSTFVVTLPCA